MQQQHVKLTSLPNGFTADKRKLRLSVFVTPKLTADDGEVGQTRPLMGTIFEDWPAKAVPLRFWVHIPSNDGIDLNLPATLDPEKAPQLSPTSRSLLWSKLFARVPALLEADVLRHELTAFSMTDRTVHTYPVREVHDILKGIYVDAAKQSALSRINQMATSRIDSVADVAARIEPGLPPLEHLAGSGSFGQLIPPPPEPCPSGQCPGQVPTDVQIKIEQALNFHDRTLQPPPPTPVVANRSAGASQRSISRDLVEGNEVEFHARVSQLGEYPALLRELGLIFDLLIDWQPNISPADAVYVSTNDSSFEQRLLKTAYLLNSSSTRFTAATSSDAELRDGLLRLDDAHKYTAVQVDVDSAVLKAADFTRNLQRAVVSEAQDAPKSLATPSLRSHGISIAKANRSETVNRMLARSHALFTTLSAGREEILHAEDLVRGYRIDVLVSGLAGPHWRSLCKRQIQFSIPDVPLQLVRDEGWVSLGISQEVLPSDPSNIHTYIHESLFSWNGWSLVAPRPGKAIAQTSPEETPPAHDNPSPLETEIKVQMGSLPMLRFGYEYRVRARATDLAGNDMSLNNQSPTDLSSVIPSADSSALKYRRFEPINSPVVVPRNDLSTALGETVDHVVLRSNFNTTPKEQPERHIAPPKTSELMSELHGTLDGPSGSPPRKDQYQLIVDHDGVLVPEGSTAGNPQSLRIFFKEEQLRLPYLPDPLSRGAAFHDLPGAPETYTRAFDGDWPDKQPFRIALVEGTGAPDWVKEKRLLKISLEKAQIARVRISSHLDFSDPKQEDLEVLGMWNWAKEAVPPPEANDALHGRFWMLTPARELLLMHAVQQPLREPTFSGGDSGAARFTLVERKIAETFVDLQGEIFFHAKSTGRVDLIGEWSEMVDDPLQPKPEVRAGNRGQILEQNITYEAEDHLQFGPSGSEASRARHEFHDTKHRNVDYYSVATTRFREQFVRVDEENQVGHPAIPLTRETPTLQRPRVNVLSSARPEIPNVLYIIPTFGWTPPRRYEDEPTETKNIERIRKGGGLRIYMDRPWYSSGDGERLAVLVWPRAPLYVQGPPPTDKAACEMDDMPAGPCTLSPGIPEKIKPYTSQWGMDPLWSSSPLNVALEVKHFLNRENITGAQGQTTYTLDELLPQDAVPYDPRCLMDAAVFTPRYDEGRQLWFCDIEMETTTTYYPFVRMALARFQPDSVLERNERGELLRDCHLSRVLLADFIQLTTGRTATITFDRKKSKTVRVTVRGVGYQSSYAGEGSSEMEVSVEERNKDTVTGWSFVPGKVFRLTRLSPPDSVSGETTWMGDVDLGKEHKHEKFRLIIREYERFRADSALHERRVVYADAIEL